MYEQALFGLVPLVFSVPFDSPSPSQSAAIQIALVGYGAVEAPIHGSSVECIHIGTKLALLERNSTIWPNSIVNTWELPDHPLG